MVETRYDMADIEATFRHFAALGLKLKDRKVDVGADNITSVITHEPVGVCALIGPWNYPLLQISWKVAPALVAGCSFIIKPSELSPSTAIHLMKLLEEAGLPKGVANLICGAGATAGAPLAEDPRVDLVSFTGGLVTGRRIMATAAQTVKKVALELGGKSPQVVLNDCTDLEAAASTIAWAIYYNAGQTCNAGSRIIVEKGVKEELFAHLHKFLESFVVGNQFDPTTQMAGLVSELQRDRVNAYLDLVGQDGEKIVYGGEKTSGKDLLIKPTLIDNVKPGSRLAQEEIFGPVLVAIDAKDEAEALQLANGTEYGLAASVWTNNVARAHKFARKLRAGTVWVNTFDMLDVITPFGGFGASGNGRDKSLHALDAYSALKTTWVDLN